MQDKNNSTWGEKTPICVVVGGQWGSESKGLVAGHICRERDIKYAVRTGAINAGHTVYHNGKKYVNQQLPVGWVNPKTELILGPGTYVHAPTLYKEREMIDEATGLHSQSRIWIDKNAGLHTDEHHHKEAGLHERMGSTGEGCMEAIKEKLERSFDYQLFKDTAYAREYLFRDTVELLNIAYDRGQGILLEGTQGTMLDLHLGEYPYVTSRQTGASAWVAEAGLSPSLQYEVVMVCRMKPIRVAGNSGALPNEISWPSLARSINESLAANGKPPIVAEAAIVAFEDIEAETKKQWGMPEGELQYYSPLQRKTFSKEISNLHKEVLNVIGENAVQAELKKLFEFTTVTKKLRRIANLDHDSLMRAVQINRPSSLAITFLNYQYPSCWGAKTWEEFEACAEYSKIMEDLKKMAMEYKVNISYVNCAPDCVIPVPANHFLRQQSYAW